VDYANSGTKELLDSTNEKMTIVVMPSAYPQIGRIIGEIELKDFRLINARSFCLEHSPQVKDALDNFFDLSNEVKCDESGVGATLTFQGKQCISTIREMGGALRTLYGSGIRFCQTLKQIETIENVLYSPLMKTTATFDNCTCCIVKPHVIKSKESGQVLNAILTEGYEVSALQIFNLNRASAAEFLEVYNGVVTEFNAMVDELISGPALVLEIRAEKAVASFRESAGPWDISFAKELFPSTIRARFGRNNVQNAVQCTDLEGDGVSEVGYFFDLVSSKC